MEPLIPLELIFIFSFCSGVNTSNSEGVFISGNSNNFKFPFPVTFIEIVAVSLDFKISLLEVTIKLKSPTAPLKLSGLLINGSSLDRTYFFADAKLLVIFLTIGFPKKSPLPVGTPITISIFIGSIVSFPDFVGIKSAFCKTTYLYCSPL